MRIGLGCIADDFTGATDLAGLMVRAGLDVSLRIGLPDAKASPQSPIEIVALKSRMGPVEEAVAISRQALAWLQRGGAERVYFKYCSTFDSTPRGNIGPVASALLADLGGSQTVYCPAFPENGRRVFMGHLFVGRDRLDESPMKDHPLTPMRDSSLLRLLAPQIGEAPGLIDRPLIARGPEAIRAAMAGLARHLIADAIDDEDIATLAAACQHLAVTTGGSAFGAALGAELARSGLPLKRDANRAPPGIGEGQITLSGSCSAMTRAQVQNYSARAGVLSLKLDPVRLAADGPAEAVAWLARQPVGAPKLVYATAEPAEVAAAQERLGVEQSGKVVEDALAEIARAAHRLGTRRFVVAGGETSGAVAGALGVRSVTIGAEIAPGVPWTFATSGGEPIALAMKSGNFGSDDFFARAHAMLERGV